MMHSRNNRIYPSFSLFLCTNNQKSEDMLAQTCRLLIYSHVAFTDPMSYKTCSFSNEGDGSFCYKLM